MSNNGNGYSRSISDAIVSQHRHGSVTERLSARVETLEATVKRMLENEAKLIADSITARRDLTLLQEHVKALTTDLERASLSFWQRVRLRWLPLGR